MIKFSSTLQCKFCQHIFPSEVFSAHLSVCTQDKGALSLINFYKHLPLQIEVIQCSLKENYKPHTVIMFIFD